MDTAIIASMISAGAAIIGLTILRSILTMGGNHVPRNDTCS